MNDWPQNVLHCCISSDSGLPPERRASNMQTASTTSDVGAGDPLSPSESYASATSSTGEEQGREDLRAIFNHFDANKDGKISREEMSSSLERLGMAVPCAELADMIDSVDANKDGFVNYEEFVGLYESLQAREIAGGGEDVELRQAFEVFDQNGDGLITAQELQSALQTMGVLQRHSLADCTAMIRRVDSDGNGQVDFQEFKHMMSRLS